MMCAQRKSAWWCRVISIVALITTIHAQGVTIQNPFDVHLFPQRFIAGTSSLVSWTPTAEGTVTLKLFAGASTDMRYVSTIAHFIENKGSFSWTPSLALEAGDDYSLLIVSDADEQLIDCSPPFEIKRPVINRDEIQSSFMSYFPPDTATSTREAATSAAATPTRTANAPATTDTVPSNSAIASSPTNIQSTNTPTNPAISTQTVTQSSSSSSLSTGAAIGIGIGATLLVLLLIGLLIFFLLRRRRQKRQQPPVPEYNATGPAELETSKSGAQEEKAFGVGGGGEAGRKSELEGGIAKPPMAELGSPPPLSPEEYAELERRRRAVELQGQSMGAGGPAELHGQTHPRVELEALRASSRNVHELGGQAILSKVQPAYRR